MKIFKIIYKRLTTWLMPVRLRQPKFLAFVRVVRSPVVWLYGKFNANRNNNLYKLKHGLHVAHLEAVLNDRWDAGFRRIRVEDAPLDYQPTMIYKTIENKPVFTFKASESQPKFLWTQDETMFGGIDFVVKVPVSIPYSPDEMRETIKYYKTPGMGFIIEEV